jgi:uncharacterized protein YbjT (DUF2867 family)
LLEAGHTVRVVVRNPDRLADVPWAAAVEIVRGDLTIPADVEAIVSGMDALYYLVHAMGTAGDFEKTEELAARNVAVAAHKAGLKRIVYLGGLHPSGELSPHLRSRELVGRILIDSGVPTVALQAGVVIGSGSASFEMIRHLTEVLPVMPAPKWVLNFIQPIAVRDVLYYLVEALTLPADVNRTFDIGGPEKLRYSEMMNGYAAEAGLAARRVIALPVLTPWLASQWVNLVTPIPRALAVPIIASLQYDCVVTENDIAQYIPEPAGGLTGYRASVGLALGRMRASDVATTWQNSTVAGAPSDPLPSDPEWAGRTVFTDLRTRKSSANPTALWKVIEAVGGDNGWYSFPLAWNVRRGRRHPQRLSVGEALDFWRVEDIERGHLLRLRAEMRVPGKAWLELTVEPGVNGGSVYFQRAIFFPKGLGGRLYWFAILPLHGIIFSEMTRRITAAAEVQDLVTKR